MEQLKKIDSVEIKQKNKVNSITLEQSCPLIAAEWHLTKNGNLKPTDVVAGSNKKVWWLGNCGHEWQAVISKRTHGAGCPICAGKQVLVGFNDLQTKNPDVAKTWHPNKNGNLKPTDVTPASGKKIWWLCERGHEWEESVYVRTSGCGCPYCSHHRTIVGYNDLTITNPAIAKQWHSTKNGDLKPMFFTENSHRKVWWKCEHGHEWLAIISSRKINGCPICAGKKVLVGFNDLATKQPKLAEQWNYAKNGDLKPTDVTCGMAKKVWWKCEYGHEWKASINNRLWGKGCPICNESKGEQSVRQCLLKNKILFKEQNSFCDRESSLGGVLRDDFAIIHNNKVIATIEYHGKQHYEIVDFSGHNPEKAQRDFRDIQVRDADKTRYLKNHNISQLIIPYLEYDNIEQLVTNFLKKLNLLT